MRLTLLLYALLFLIPTTSRADTVWTYTGNSINYAGDFYNPGPSGGPVPLGDIQPNPCNCALSGSVTLDAGGNPVAWNFSAAGVTWDTTNSSFVQLNDNIADQSPLFTLWNLQLVDTQGDTLATLFTTFSMLSARDSSSNGLTVFGDPGTWTDPVSTPEPPTLAAVAIALALFVMMFYHFTPRSLTCK